MRRLLPTALACALLFSATSATALPRNVTMLRGAVTHASAAPNGEHVAYFSQDGALNLYSTAAKKTRRVFPEEYATGYPIRWSLDGKSLAFSSAAGVFVFDLATGRAVRKVVGRVSDFSFDARGRLCHIKGGRWVFCAGKSLVKLSKRASVVPLIGHQAPALLAPLATASQRDGVLSCQERFRRERSECRELSLWQLATGRTKTLYRAGKAERGLGGLLVSPTRDRVCFGQRAGLRCLQLASGRTHHLGRGLFLGHSGHPPYSPSGKRFAYFKRQGKKTALHVFDFATGKSRVVLRDTPFKDVVFQTERHVLLYENWRTRKRAAVPQLVRVDVTSGKATVLVKDSTQYTIPVIVPGHPEVLFTGRENHNGGRDLVRVRLPRP